MKIALAVIITVIVIIALGFAFMYSGIYDVAAIKPAGKIEAWFFSTISDKSVEYHAGAVKAPTDFSQQMVDSGFQHFNRNCYGCHGAPGVDPVGAAKGMNPRPPDLSKNVGDLSDAQLFWIIKNGIKMTAMPAYGTIFDDAQIWNIVAFVRLLPKTTAQQYEDYKIRL